ncbi:MAG TPA: LysR family transcriptional regulator [Gammaproteobacteria bacterium]|nr:LysR family transcriptional regulator [Gammaproteobacteria bacterium]
MDQIQQIRAFVTVAEELGFAAAARRLQISPAAVTRLVAGLEQRLGVTLLVRTTRHVRTTEAGDQYLEDARRILAQLEAADAAVAGSVATPQGHLTVTAPLLFGRHYVLPVVTDYLNCYSETTVSTLFLDRNVNLVEEGVDVAVRLGALADSSMRARRVGQVSMVVCAAPAYLRDHQPVKAPADLADHTLIHTTAGNNAVAWRFPELRQRLKPRLTVTSNDTAIDAARSGFGLARVLSYQVAPFLERGELELVLTSFQPEPWPIHVVHREGPGGAARTRTFIDMLATELKANAALQAPGS